MRVIDLATLVLAAIAAVVELAGPVWANWITRPLVNLLLLLVAAAGTRGAYRTLILIGLASAAIGDLLPLFSGGLFFVSLVVFLTVHLCYIAAFWPGVGLHGAWIARLVYLTLGVAMVAALWPVLPPLQRVAIAVYAALIVTMAGQAAGRWSVLRTAGARSAGLGAGLGQIRRPGEHDARAERRHHQRGLRPQRREHGIAQQPRDLADRERTAMGERRALEPRPEAAAVRHHHDHAPAV